MRQLRKYILICSFLLLQSCATSHDRFVEAMDFYVHYQYKLSQVVAESGHRWADPEFLYSEEKTDKGLTLYHYAHPNIFDSYCHCFFVVDDDSDLIVGWGFDPKKSDPKKNCGISGGT